VQERTLRGLIRCTGAAAIALALASSSAMASKLDDLVYQDLDWGQKQLQQRGYQIAGSDAA
jgi:hypothetical protein